MKRLMQQLRDDSVTEAMSAIPDCLDDNNNSKSTGSGNKADGNLHIDNGCYSNANVSISFGESSEEAMITERRGRDCNSNKLNDSTAKSIAHPPTVTPQIDEEKGHDDAKLIHEVGGASSAHSTYAIENVDVKLES